MIKTGCKIVTVFGRLVAENAVVEHISDGLIEEIGLCCVNMVPMLVHRRYDGSGTWYVGSCMDSSWRQRMNTPFVDSCWESEQ